MARGQLGWAVVVAAALLAPVPAAADRGRDHPLVGRYEGSELLQYRHREFDEYVLPLGAFEDGEYAETRRIEGEITWIGYRNPDGRSTLEVFRNYEDKLAAGDFTEVWRCEGSDACGYWFADRLMHADPERFLHAADTGADEDIRYLVSRRRGGGRDVHVQIVVYDDGTDVWTRVRVIEAKARERDKIVVKADEMAARIAEQGSVALYGIYFDTDSARVKPESAATLAEIARLLADRPGLELLVVGHTDNRGAFDYNIDLSTRRAAAVVDALVADYGVDRQRLTPWGVGFTAPAASNATEAGRAKNRRVELVRR